MLRQNRNVTRRNEIKENSVKILKSKEKPFSFYERDIEKKKAKEDVKYVNEELTRPPFKANEVPTI